MSDRSLSQTAGRIVEVEMEGSSQADSEPWSQVAGDLDDEGVDRMDVDNSEVLMSMLAAEVAKTSIAGREEEAEGKEWWSHLSVRPQKRKTQDAEDCEGPYTEGRDQKRALTTFRSAALF